ncbi:MAG: acylphosphatase [Chthoniobacterales bacterium]
MKAVIVHYAGRVQGVGFRFTAKSLARGFDVVGTIKNLPDGRVEQHVQGDADEVDAFLQALRESVLAGHIQEESLQPGTVESGLRGFRILD